MLLNTLKKGIYIIHENPEWIPPFHAAFDRAVKSGEIPKDIVFFLRNNFVYVLFHTFLASFDKFLRF